MEKQLIILFLLKHGVEYMGKYVSIYSLSHPITKEIRYIGKAAIVEERIKKHLNEKKVSHKTNWIKLLKKDGLLPLVEIVDEIPEYEWSFWEKHYISLYKSYGCNLINETDGGNGGAMGMAANEKRRKKLMGHILSDETKRKIGLKNKGSKRSELLR